MDLDEGLHGVAFAFDPGLPAVELAGTFGALQVDLVARDDGEPAVLAFAIDGDVNLALEGVELEGLGDLDELELLRLGELGGKAEGCEEIENCLALDFDGDCWFGLSQRLSLGTLEKMTLETSYGMGSPISID